MSEAKVYVPLKEAVEALKKQIREEDPSADSWGRGWDTGHNTAIQEAIYILSKLKWFIVVPN